MLYFQMMKRDLKISASKGKKKKMEIEEYIFFVEGTVCFLPLL